MVDQVKAGQIPANLWPYLGSALGGDDFQFVDAAWAEANDGKNVGQLKAGHIASGNQNFFQGPRGGGLTQERRDSQLALIDELLPAVSDPQATKALRSARNVLLKRPVVQVSSATPPRP